MPTKRARHAVIQVECLEDLRYWVDTNRKTALRVLDLMEAAPVSYTHLTLQTSDLV